MSRIAGESKVHRYAVFDEGTSAFKMASAETALKELVSKVDALIAGGDAVLFPKSQWNSMVDSHRPKLSFQP